MSSLRDQETLDGPVLPLIFNNCNFIKAEPSLLSFDDARTVFHEFGHALHGLLSQVRFPRLSGTNVARDFVELPSQLFEHWLEEPQVLARFARHYQTGEPMPAALMEKLLAARHFNQGFETVEYPGLRLPGHGFPQPQPGKFRSRGPANGVFGRYPACRTRSFPAMLQRTLGISSPGRAIAPAIILIYGPRYWMQTVLAPSGRRKTLSPPLLQRGSTTISTPAEGRGILRKPIATFAAVIRKSKPC